MNDKIFTNQSDLKESGITIFTLFTTAGTLLCCALPIVFVTLGMGATVVALTSSFPFLIVMSQHKIWIFIFSGIMLVISGWLMFRPGRACPAGQGLGAACSLAHKWNKRIYWGSIVIWSTGFFTAYLLLPIRITFDL